MVRPEHLAEYNAPPVAEVVVSVQFATPPNYQHIFALDIWNIYRKRFSQVTEHPPISPTFEVFGAAQQRVHQFNIVPLQLPPHRRYWFSEKDGIELLQFQPDRFMRNWRNTAGKTPYIRFDKIINEFESDIRALDEYFKKTEWGPILPNQCEVTYVNPLPLLNDRKEPINPQFYFSKMNLNLPNEQNDFAARMQTDIKTDSHPIGRLVVEAITGTNDQDQPVLNLTLSVRGAPAKPTIEDSISFLSHGRNIIVQSFTEITSEAAHELWGRTK